jgi:hypothetical protein
MNGKITLITPPDIWENENLSILLINLQDSDQIVVSEWLKNLDYDKNINLYFYTGEENTIWFLYALSRANYTFINVDQNCLVTNLLLGHVLGKNNVFYKTQNNNVSAVLSHINQNKITKIEYFLEEVFNKVRKNEE